MFSSQCVSFWFPLSMDDRIFFSLQALILHSTVYTYSESTINYQSNKTGLLNPAGVTPYCTWTPFVYEYLHSLCSCHFSFFRHMSEEVDYNPQNWPWNKAANLKDTTVSNLNLNVFCNPGSYLLSWVPCREGMEEGQIYYFEALSPDKPCSFVYYAVQTWVGGVVFKFLVWYTSRLHLKLPIIKSQVPWNLFSSIDMRTECRRPMTYIFMHKLCSVI